MECNRKARKVETQGCPCIASGCRKLVWRRSYAEYAYGVNRPCFTVQRRPHSAYCRKCLLNHSKWPAKYARLGLFPWHPGLRGHCAYLRFDRRSELIGSEDEEGQRSMATLKRKHARVTGGWGVSQCCPAHFVCKAKVLKCGLKGGLK